VFDFIGVRSSANVLFDLVAVTPATIFIAKLMKALYTCPIGFSVEYRVANPCAVTLLRWLGKLFIIPILSLIVGLLVVAAIFTRGYDTVRIVTMFFLQVQLYGFFLELLLTMLMFMSTFYMRSTIDLSFASIVLLEVGRRYSELIHINKQVEGKDYHYRCYYIFCVLRIECIYRFDDAIKKGYVKEEDRIQDDVEMTVSSVSRYTRASDAISRGIKGNIPMIDPKVDSDVTDGMDMDACHAEPCVLYTENKHDALQSRNNHNSKDDVYVGYETSYDSCNQDVLGMTINSSYGSATSNPMHPSMRSSTKSIAHKAEGTQGESQATTMTPNYVINRNNIDADPDEADEDMASVQRKAFKDGKLYSLIASAVSLCITLIFAVGTRESFIEVYRKFEEQEILGGMSASSARANQFHAVLNSSKNGLDNKTPMDRSNYL